MEVSNFYYRLNFLEHDLGDRIRILKLPIDKTGKGIEALPLTANSALTIMAKWLENLYYNEISELKTDDLTAIASQLYWKPEALLEIFDSPDTLPETVRDKTAPVLAYALFINSRSFPVELKAHEEFVLEDLLSSYTGKDKIFSEGTKKIFLRLFHHSYEYMSRDFAKKAS